MDHDDKVRLGEAVNSFPDEFGHLTNPEYDITPWRSFVAGLPQRKRYDITGAMLKPPATIEHAEFTVKRRLRQ